MSELVIAIDGPAGAGKSTVAKALAKELGLNYLDTGAMYRAIAWKAREHNLRAADGEAVAKLLEDTDIDFAPGEPQHVLVDGVDVTDAIRTMEIGELASTLSAHSAVRRVLAQRQKDIVEKGGVTLEGRDVTTVIAPHAQVKVYLTASLEERARRRHVENSDKGITGEYLEVRQLIEQRDHRDITREDSPLTIAEGATVIDSANRSIDEVIEAVKRLIPSKYR